MFKEFVPQDVQANKELVRCVLRLLDQRKRVRQANTFLKQPVVSFLLAITMVIIGALVSQLIGSGFQISVLALALIGMAVILISPFIMVLRSRAYRDAELTEFLLWLSIDNKI